MALMPILLICLTALGLAYVLYGKLVVSRFYRLDCDAPTPATLYKDGQDYVPTNRFYLLAQHFSAISAAGPIFGPIIAGLMFGWFPALLWIVFGCIFIGAVHDFSTLIGSVRHRGSSVAEVVRMHIGSRAFYLFLGFHLGEIMVEGEQIHGEGINTAVRIEGLAEAGGICISEIVYDQIKSRLSLVCEDLGEHLLKNIAKPVRVYRVVLEEADSPQSKVQSLVG